MGTIFLTSKRTCISYLSRDGPEGFTAIDIFILHDDSRGRSYYYPVLEMRNLRLDKMTSPIIATQLVSRGARTEAQSHRPHT